MKKIKQNIREKIANLLKVDTMGLSASQIAKKTGHSRITITKYLEVMKAQGLLTSKTVAQAVLWQFAFKKPRVLVVDDEPHIAHLIALSLPPEKYLVDIAYTGIEALQKILAKPDIVVLDIMMPGLDGYEVCRHIRKNSLTKNIPVILLSAKKESKDKLKGADIGANEYLTKPFNPLELEETIRHLLETEHQKQTNISSGSSIFLLRSEIERREALGNTFSIISISLESAEPFCSRDQKKTNDAKMLFTRYLAQELHDDTLYLTHVSSNELIVLSSKNQMDWLRKSVQSLWPYIKQVSSGKLLNVVIQKIENLSAFDTRFLQDETALR